MKTTNLSYWIPTGLLLLMMLMGSIYYATNVELVVSEYQALGFPAWIMYFNGIAKFLGIFALVLPTVPKFLKEFAYAGYVYVFTMAIIAHVLANDNMQWGAIAALVFWAFSYRAFRKQA